VTLTGPDERAGRTEQDGSFAFSTLVPGEYELSATLAGFAPARRTIRLEPAGTITVSLTLSVQILEHMVVTAATTDEGDVQATPIAVSVIPARDLERLAAHTVEDAARQMPAVTFSQNTGFAQLTIRGIGTNAVFTGSDPSSAMYVDGVYMARPAMVLTDLLDLDRIEVLRGPQGTLYGRNAVGGALNVVTKIPTNDRQASARFVAGSYGTVRAAARLSGPIAAERVMGSVALLRGVSRGFVRDVDHPDHPLGGEDVSAARAKLRIATGRRTELALSGDASDQTPTPLTYAKVLAVKPGVQVDNPASLHDVRTSTAGRSRNLQYGAALRATTKVTPGITVASLTAFRKLDYDVLADTDITELDLASSHVHEIQHQWSEEVTVSHQRARSAWSGGLFLFDDIDSQPTAIRFGSQRVENRINPIVNGTSKAVFGQGTLALTPRLLATAGLRYTHEGRRLRNQGQLIALDSPVPLATNSAFAYSDVLSDGAWTPKFGLEMHVNERTLTYVSATRGFKSGGFNISSTQATGGFAPEWAWSYEAGVKTLAARRTKLNMSAFFTDYSNLQVQIAIRPGLLDISNAAAATIKGLEVESETDVLPSLRLGGFLTWLDTRYDRYVAVGVGGVTGDVAGNALNNAPRWAGRLWLDSIRSLSRIGTLSVRPEVVWQSTAFFTPFNDRIQRQSPFALLNLSAELRPKTWCCTITLYARNLTDQDYITGTFSSPPPAIGGRPGPRRQVGVEVALGQ
jgi:iron complex outermembrane recepter protein